MTLDFNNIKALQLLSDMLNGIFDRIILDNGVFYSTKWTREHLNLFKMMLKSDGEFIFMPTYNGYYLGYKEQSVDDIKLTAEKEIMLAEKDGLLVIPYFHFSESWLCKFKQCLSSVEIKEPCVPKNALTRIFRNYGGDNVPEYILSLDWSPENRPADLCECVIFYEMYIAYYVRVLKSVFGDENVKTVEKGTLPFKQHYTGRLNILITATRSLKS